jgi:hypothetical protein
MQRSTGSLHETPFSSKCVGQEDQEQTTADHLDDAVDTSGKQAIGIACDSEIVEDGWCVVVDGVGTGHLLADHDDDCEDCTSAIARDGPEFSHDAPEACATVYTCKLFFQLALHFEPDEHSISMELFH